MKPDARGWYWYEKLSIVASYWAFRACDAALAVAQWTLKRTPIRWRPWLHNSRFCMWLASECYLYDDLRRGDMPENLRVGGVWR